MKNNSLADQAEMPDRKDTEKMNVIAAADRAPPNRKKNPTLSLNFPRPEPAPPPEVVPEVVPEVAQKAAPAPPAAPKANPDKAAWKPNNPVIMSHEDLQAILKELNCSVATVAHFFGANERAGRRWYSGNLLIPPAIACLIRCAVLAAKDKPYGEIADAMAKEADLLRRWGEAREARLAAKEKKKQAKA